MSSSHSQPSLHIVALVATSTLGALCMWKALSKTRISQKDYHHHQDCEDETAVTTDTSSSSISLDDSELDEILTIDNQNIDIKSFRHVVQEKQGKASRKKRAFAQEQSKLTVFSKLISKLEKTIGERLRMEEKLKSLRDNHNREPATFAPKLTSPSTIDSKSNSSSSSSSSSSKTSVGMVVQRCRGATVLVNDNELSKVGTDTSKDHSQALLNGSSEHSCGLLVYVSFAKGCTQQSVRLAAKIIVNLPILTTGGWGDGVSSTVNVIDLATQHANAASIVVVPQANLINKIKAQGKSIQYHAQIDREEGSDLYHYFVNCVRGLVLEQQCKLRKETLPDWYQRSLKSQSGSSSNKIPLCVPPEDLFQNCALYSSWDESGIPLTDAEGENITKSAQKKLRKAQAGHKVKHLKYLREKSRGEQKIYIKSDNNGSLIKDQPSKDQPKEEHWATSIDPSFVKVVAGSFGNRQSLEFIADMGPFCHVIQV